MHWNMKNVHFSYVRDIDYMYIGILGNVHFPSTESISYEKMVLNKEAENYDHKNRYNF